jgi:hypothetical protein
MYLKANNGIIQKYPYTLIDLHADNPNVSFPRSITEEILNSYDVFTVVSSGAPSYDTTTQGLSSSYPHLISDIWTISWVITELTPEEIAANTESIRYYKLKELATFRYQKEISGLSMPLSGGGSITISTDRSSQAMINGLKSFIELNPTELINFKGDDGWVDIDSTTALIIANVVGFHVQQCFRNEYNHSKAINLLQNHLDIINYDITTGWPT